MQLRQGAMQSCVSTIVIMLRATGFIDDLEFTVHLVKREMMHGCMHVDRAVNTSRTTFAACRQASSNDGRC